MNVDDDDHNFIKSKLQKSLSIETAYDLLKEYLESANILSRNALENKKTQKIFDNWQLLQSMSVCRCLELMCCDNLGKMEASARVADIMYGKRGQKSYKAEPPPAKNRPSRRPF